MMNSLHLFHVCCVSVWGGSSRARPWRGGGRTWRWRWRGRKRRTTGCLGNPQLPCLLHLQEARHQLFHDVNKVFWKCFKQQTSFWKLTCLSLSLPVSLYLYVCPSLSLYLSLSTCLSVPLSLSTCLSLPVCLSLSLSTCLCDRGCDSCSEWFHGNCIGVSEKAAKAIRVWYCPSCRGQCSLISANVSVSVSF